MKSQINTLKAENKALKEQLKLVDQIVGKMVKEMTRGFTEASMKYALFKPVNPTMTFSLEMPEDDILGQFLKPTEEIVVYLPSFMNTIFMQEFKKGNEVDLIKFLTESIQHEYCHACLKETGIFSMSDEEEMVDALMRNQFSWWRK